MLFYFIVHLAPVVQDGSLGIRPKVKDKRHLRSFLCCLISSWEVREREQARSDESRRPSRVPEPLFLIFRRNYKPPIASQAARGLKGLSRPRPLGAFLSFISSVLPQLGDFRRNLRTHALELFPRHKSCNR